MAVRTQVKKKKIAIQTLVHGAIAATLYAAVFTYSTPITELFARGGFYPALPIATVFLFSFAHGAFASNLWSLLGIEAMTKTATKRQTVSAPRPTQRPRARLRMSA